MRIWEMHDCPSCGSIWHTCPHCDITFCDACGKTEHDFEDFEEEE